MSSAPGATPRQPRDAGLTLVEVLVAMVCASILLAGVGVVFAGTLRGVSTTTTKTSTGADVRLAMSAMSRTVSVATVPAGQSAAFTSASTVGMTFYALLNRTGDDSDTQPIPSLVQYSYSSTTNCLSEAQTPGSAIANPATGGPYYAWPSTATSTRCLLRTASAPTFSYYTSGSLAVPALSAAAGLSAANLAAVRSVDLYLVATDPANPSVTGIPDEIRITLANVIALQGS